ncbi:20S proteasome alpha subunit PAD1 [Actinidia rufa]|uniref:20S proteasome alpha subunit PAD1 n=1 Tax=Actinidia rufa TaxID=165716 RepID=A0A7J0ENR2_9ERIC|nr:20S proteasome alpha subunit PAD1 [Actinidia rufa]
MNSNRAWAWLLDLDSSKWAWTHPDGLDSTLVSSATVITVVKSGGKNIEVAVMTKKHGLRQLDEAEIDAIVAEIEAEKDVAEATKKGPPKGT